MRQSRPSGSDAQAGYRPVEPGVAEAEDAAVRGHQPVAQRHRGRRDADHRTLSLSAPVEP